MSKTTDTFNGSRQIYYELNKRNTEAVIALIRDNPALVSSENSLRQTPFWLASCNGLTEVVKEMLQEPYKPFLDVEKKDSGFRDALDAAKAMYNEDIVEILNPIFGVGVYTHADEIPKEIFDEANKLVYLLACSDNDAAIALLKNNPRLASIRDLGGMSPISIAAKKGSVEVVKELLNETYSEFFDISKRDPSGYHALDYAKFADHQDIVKILRPIIGPEPCVNTKTVPEGLLEEAKEIYTRLNDGDGDGAIALLQDNPELVTTENSIGQTPLCLASLNGLFEVVKEMLKTPYKPFLKVDKLDHFGRDALNVADDFSRSNIIRLLDPVIKEQAKVSRSKPDGLDDVGYEARADNANTGGLVPKVDI